MQLQRIDNGEHGWGNVYYCPDKYGCELVASIDVAGDYEFDMFVVVKTTMPLPGIRKGTYFYAADAGCSCPSPFEGADWTKATKSEVIKAFDAWCIENASWRTGFDAAKLEMKNKLYSL